MTKEIGVLKSSRHIYNACRKMIGKQEIYMQLKVGNRKYNEEVCNITNHTHSSCRKGVKKQGSNIRKQEVGILLKIYNCHNMVNV